MKTWKLLLAAMMALVMLFAVSALAEATCDDSHTVTVWEVVTKPTCTQPGTDKGICDVCGEEVTREVEATGHAWVPDEEFPAIEPTCTEDGRAAQYYCDMCWLLKGGETIPATGHTVTT